MYDTDTIDITPAPDEPKDDTPKSADHDSGSTDSNFPYFLRNHKFSPYSTNTTKDHKMKEKIIDDKVTIDTTLYPDKPGADNPNYFAQYSGSTGSYLPYSMRNCNQYCKISPNTKKTT